MYKDTCAQFQILNKKYGTLNKQNLEIINNFSVTESEILKIHYQV